jgi:amino acid transporter
LMQAFEAFLQAFNMTWLLGPLALLVTIGGLATLSSWLAGPALGLGVVATEGLMPPVFSRRNKVGAPTGVLILQAVLGTIISLVYLFIPSINSAYWLLSALTVTLLCIVYLMVFAALIKLRYSQPNTPRAFKIPGGIMGAWIIGGLGLLSSGFTFFVSLFPTGSMNVSVGKYALFMLIGTAILALPPLVFIRLKKSSWKPAEALEE